jgi:hypothetical protein
LWARTGGETDYYIDVAGTFTKIFPHGASLVNLQDINNQNIAYGTYETIDGVFHPFVDDAGKVTTFNPRREFFSTSSACSAWTRTATWSVITKATYTRFTSSPPAPAPVADRLRGACNVGKAKRNSRRPIVHLKGRKPRGPA